MEKVNFKDALIGTQVQLKNIVGKTIKAVSVESETLVIVYTDNSFSINSKYQPDYEDYFEIDFENHYFEHLSPVLKNGKLVHSSIVLFLVKQGVVSGEILDKLSMDYVRQYNEKKEQKEYLEWLRLKEKFEK